MEPFDPAAIGHYCAAWGLPRNAPLFDYLTAALDQGTTDNGIFGCKIHWNEVSWLRTQLGVSPGDDAFLERLFPNAKYINLIRRDRRNQAISLYRANGSNTWWRHLSGKSSHLAVRPEPPFDSAAIRRLENSLTHEHNGWAGYFLSRSITPLQIEYESLALYRRHEIARVLEFLGQDPTIADKIREPPMLRQADETTIAWKRALDAEDER